MTTRGLVIAPRFVWDPETSSLHFPGLVGIEPADLRHYLLYWDRLDWPDNNIISIGDSPDTEFLRQERILTRTRVNFSGRGSVETSYVVAQVVAFEHLSSQEAGQWSLGQAADALLDPRSSAEHHRTVEIELYSALPSPPPTVSLADVLEFKQRRNSELLALRQVLDDLYLRIVSSPDMPRAKDVAIAKVEAALADLDRAASESWPTRLRRSVKVELKLPDVAKMALLGGAFAAGLQLPLSLGAAAGALSAAIKFEAKSLKGPRLSPELIDFAYLFHLPRELG